MDPPQPSVIPVTLGGLKPTGSSSIVCSQRNVQVTTNLRLQLPSLEQTQFEPNLHVQHHINVVNTRSLLLVQLRSPIRIQNHHLLTLEDSAQHARRLMMLKQRFQILGTEPNIMVQRTRFDVVVVDPNPLVGVTHRDVEGKIVIEGVGVGGVVELGQRCVGDVELDHVGAHDKPEEKSDDGYDDDDEGQEFAYEAEDAAATAFE